MDITRSLLTRPQLELFKREAAGTEMDLSAFMYHEGIVSGIALGLGGADFQSRNVSGSCSAHDTNELIVFQDARYRCWFTISAISMVRSHKTKTFLSAENKKTSLSTVLPVSHIVKTLPWLELLTGTSWN